MCRAVAELDPALRFEEAQIDLVTTGCAVYSACGQYRYVLGRSWNGNRPAGVFVMLNPSTATVDENDPTIERCVRRARQLNWGRLVVLNLFALRATQRARLRAPGVRPEGQHNERAWIAMLNGPAAGAPVICAWGNDAAKVRLRDARRRFAELAQEHGWQLQALRMTRAGQPGHPLYLAYAHQPEPLDAGRLE